MFKVGLVAGLGHLGLCEKLHFLFLFATPRRSIVIIEQNTQAN